MRALSWLRWGTLEGLLNVTGIDPLIEVYEIILARHGLLGLPGSCRPEGCPGPLSPFTEPASISIITTSFSPTTR